MRRKISILTMAITLIGVLSAFIWYNWQNGNIQHDVLGLAQPGKIVNGPATLGTQVNVLLVGADQRPSETKYNTDSIILASINPEAKRICLLSIPRDTRVQLPGQGYVKINSLVALAGFNTLEQEVTDLTGVPVSGYIETNFNGFKKIIDTLGGITVNVEKDMYYVTGDKQDGVINLHKGVQRLDGTKALEYARFRHDALADISRTARQQVVLKAVAQEMFKVSTIPKLPVLIPELMDAVQTNLSLNDILKLAKVAVGFQSSDIVAQTLPGAFLNLDGESYWDVDPTAAKEVVSNLLQGITTNKIINQETINLLTPNTTTNKPLPTVPGNSTDPNGQDSADYRQYLPAAKQPDNNHTKPNRQQSSENGNFQEGWPAGPDGGA